MKKLLSILLLVVFLLAAVAGCGNQATTGGDEPATKTEPTTGTEPATETEPTTEEAPAMSKEPITFTLFTKDVRTFYDNGDGRIPQKIKELTGVTIVQEFPVGDLKQKIGLMIASNDYPDMIFAGDQGQPQLVDAGAFIKLDDYYEKFGPNLKKMFGDYMKRLRYSKDNPYIYVVGSPVPGVGQQQWRPNMGFWVSHMVTKDQNFPSLKTLNDVENAVKTYYEKNPTIDGKPTIPITLIAEDWRWLCSPGNMGAFSTGKPDDGQWYVDPTTYEATYRFYLPDHKEFYRWLNKMNAQGLLDKEAFTQKYDQYLAKISSGRVLSAIDQQWQIQSGLDSLKTNGMEDRGFGCYPAQLEESYVCADFRDMGYSGGWGIGITTSCKDPERAFQFLDWYATDEAQILTNWGEEGVDYEYKDGKRVLYPEILDRRNNDTEKYNRESGIGNWNYPFPRWGDGVVDSSGNTYTFTTRDQLMVDLSKTDKEVLKGYGAELWMDLYPKATDLPISAWGAAWQIPIESGSELDITLNKCNDIMRSGVPEAVLAKPADFDSVWDGLMADLKKAGVEEMNANFTKQIQGRVELWK